MMTNMSNLSTCPDCGSSDIVDDAHYSQSQLVCAACGFVLTEGLLTTTQAEEGFAQGVKFSESTGEQDGISRHKLRGILRVRTICKTLRLPITFEETAVSYFERAFNHPAFHLARREKKEIVAGCCVYITCRQHTWPLTIGTVCSLLYFSKTSFASTYLNLVKALELDVPALSLSEMVKAHCKSFRLLQRDGNVPAHFLEDKDKVVERTLQVMEIAAETWLVSGRQPIPIINAAAYLAWQSLCPAFRLSCSVPRFCKLAEIEHPRPVRNRLKEILSVLTKLAFQLPWLKTLPVNSMTAVQYLGDILLHRSFLLRQALCAGTAQGNPMTDSCLQNMPLGTEGFSGSTDIDEDTDERVQATSVKRPFLPPSAENPKKKLLSQPLPSLQTVTGDEDISDCEIEALLRTKEEIAEYLRAQPLFAAGLERPG